MFQRDKMLAALRWLAANPDKHIGGFLAENRDRISVTTRSPEAVCFCALGRYAHEAGIDTKILDEHELGLSEMIEDHTFSNIYSTNDYWIKLDKSDALRRVGNLVGITEEEIFNAKA